MGGEAAGGDKRFIKRKYGLTMSVVALLSVFGNSFQQHNFLCSFVISAEGNVDI